jgi:hypothetical protein
MGTPPTIHNSPTESKDVTMGTPPTIHNSPTESKDVTMGTPGTIMETPLTIHKSPDDPMGVQPHILNKYLKYKNKYNKLKASKLFF